MDNRFITHASNGKIEEVKKMILNGQDVNIQDENGRTALMFAVFFNQFETVEYLLDTKECDINKQDQFGNTALMFAANEDYPAIALILQFYNADTFIKNKYNLSPYLIANKYKRECEKYIPPPGSFDKWKYPDFNDKTMIFKYAMKLKNFNLINFALRKELYNLDVIYDSLRTLIRMKDKDLLNFLVCKQQIKEFLNYFEVNDNYRYKTLLMHACDVEYIEGIEILLNNGANPFVESSSKNALIIGIKKKNIKIVKILLDNKQNTTFNYETVLENIFDYDFEDALNELIERGLSVDYIYQSCSLVIWATKKVAFNCLKLLLENGANPNSGHPYTALAEVNFPSYKILERHDKEKAFIELLLQHGADVNVKNKANVTITLVHMKNKNVDNLILLLSRVPTFYIEKDSTEITDLINSMKTSFFSYANKLQLLTILHNLNLISEKKRDLFSYSNAKRTYRVTVCHGCLKSIDELNGMICKKCKWILCECGSCGCNYRKSDL